MPRKKQIISKSFNIEGKKVFSFTFKLGANNLVVLKARRGYIICGYLNLKTAEKFSDAACVVKGVANTQELLCAKIISLTKFAYNLGVRKGMNARSAVKFLS